MAARMIPEPQRTELAGVYAYCRYTDDLVDHATCSSSEILVVLDEWERLSLEAYRGHHTGIALLAVVIGTMEERGVPFAYVRGLLQGMRADITGTRFDTMAELHEYCYNVASVVGMWLTELFGVPIECLPQIVPTADRLGETRSIPVTASLVDQQAALFGHGCRRKGDAKITFGTGAFALAVAGDAIPRVIVQDAPHHDRR
jgi:phytoene/squalene synthetase